jgi:hypothetical protein
LQIVFTLMMKAICSSESLVLTKATRRNIQEDDILHSYRRKNLKYYNEFWHNSDYDSYLSGQLSWCGKGLQGAQQTCILDRRQIFFSHSQLSDRLWGSTSLISISRLDNGDESITLRVEQH